MINPFECQFFIHTAHKLCHHSICWPNSTMSSANTVLTPHCLYYWCLICFSWSDNTLADEISWHCRVVTSERYHLKWPGQLDCMFKSLFMLTLKENIKALHCWPFVRGTHWWILPQRASYTPSISIHHINGLVQERRNSIANAMELRLSCTNPSTSSWYGRNFKS